MITRFIALTFLVLSSCFFRENNNEVQSEELTFSVNLHDVEHQKDKAFYYSEYFDNFHLLPLETNSECIIGSIKQLKIYNGSVYVLDNQTKLIYAFSSEGKYKKKIGSFGRGPKEYLEPIFTYDEQANELIIYCKLLKKFIIYNNDGIPTREFKYDNGFEIKYIEFYDGNLYLNANPSPNNDKSHYLIYVINKNGKEIHKWMKNRGIYTSMEESRLGSLYKMGNKLLFYESYLDTIYFIQNDMLYPYISTYSNDASKLADISAIHKIGDAEKRLNTMYQYNKAWGRHNFIENEKLIHFSYNIGHQIYTVVYKRRDNLFKLGFFIDDITNDMNLRFFDSNDDCFIGLMKNSKMGNPEIFKQAIKQGKIKIDDKEKEKAMKLTRESNPILIYYNIKD